MSQIMSPIPCSVPRLATTSLPIPYLSNQRPRRILVSKAICCNNSAFQEFNKPFHIKCIESAAKCSLSLAATFLLISAPPALSKEEIFGIPRVVDGDTLVVNGTRIRLFGIDAPESKQSCTKAGKNYECGTASKNALQEKIATSPVRCAVKKKDMYGRSVAICRLDPPKGPAKLGEEEGLDLNGWLVREGWAVAYKRYSKSYVPFELAAQEERKGIWSGKFEDPETWRKEHKNGRSSKLRNISRGTEIVALGENSAAQSILKTPSVAAGVAVAPSVATIPSNSPGAINTELLLPDISSTCLIKGNISAKGAKIYHLPGGRFYEATRINIKAGEKYFCSEEEAIAAGWRASKG